MTISNTRKYAMIVNNCICSHNSKYITYKSIQAKTGLSRGKVSIGIRVLKEKGILKRRSQATWIITKTTPTHKL